MLKALEREKAENVDAALYELVAHELLRRLEFTPTFKPAYKASANKKLSPDMDVMINGQKYIVDVFLTHNAIKTIKRGRDRFRLTVNQGENAKNIHDKIIQKCGKYASIQKPIILVVFLGDHNVELLDVSRALYGAGLEDGWLKDKFPFGIADFQREISSKFNQELPGGAILPDEEGVPRCANLSAVLACDWFDSLDKNRPGKRLYCIAFHHWQPNVPIPPARFSNFREVVWSQNSSNSYDLRVINSFAAVAKFAQGDRLEFGNDSVGDS
ncbi:MAG: hypothetical protein ACRD10_02745 [Terriglobia bacterium]